MTLRERWIDFVEGHDVGDIERLAELAEVTDAGWLLTALLHGESAEAVLVMRILARRPLHRDVAALAVAARIEADPIVRAAVDAAVRRFIGWTNDREDLWTAGCATVDPGPIIVWTASHLDDVDLRRVVRAAVQPVISGWGDALLEAVHAGSDAEAVAALHLADETAIGRDLARAAMAREGSDVKRWLFRAAPNLLCDELLALAASDADPQIREMAARTAAG